MKLPYAPVGLVSTIALIALSGCATKPATVAIAPPPAPVAPVVVAMPKGAYAGMQIPARLPDGGYVTPNRNLIPRCDRLAPAGRAERRRAGVPRVRRATGSSPITTRC